MEKIFNNLCESLFSQLMPGENLVLSLNGENSQFVRFNNASVRQTGMVDDADLGLKFILMGVPAMEVSPFQEIMMLIKKEGSMK